MNLPRQQKKDWDTRFSKCSKFKVVKLSKWSDIITLQSSPRCSKKVNLCISIILKEFKVDALSGTNCTLVSSELFVRSMMLFMWSKERHRADPYCNIDKLKHYRPIPPKWAWPPKFSSMIVVKQIAWHMCQWRYFDTIWWQRKKYTGIAIRNLMSSIIIRRHSDVVMSKSQKAA